MNPPPDNTIKIAESILSQHLNADVSLQAEDGLGGSNRSNVFRCGVSRGPSDAPSSIVVKQAVASGDEVYDPDSAEAGPALRLFNEWAALAFLSEVSVGELPVPRFYGGDRGAGVIVLEDLGNGKRLDHLLLGDNVEAATAGLVQLVTATGRMHAMSIGKRARANEIRLALGPTSQSQNMSTAAEGSLTTKQLGDALRSTADTVGVSLASGIDTDLEVVGAFWDEPSPFDALVHSDPCPDNCLFTDSGLKILDFEFAKFNHALIDGVYGRIHFPTCWCVNRIPNRVVLDMEKAYRQSLAQGCPQATDDTLFYRAVVEACAYWTLGMFRWAMPRVLEKDDDWGISTWRQRFVLRLTILADTVEEFLHLEALGKTARVMVRKFRDTWPNLEEMPLYPAFRQ